MEEAGTTTRPRTEASGTLTLQEAQAGTETRGDEGELSHPHASDFVKNTSH
jgi:hypothetical protein